MASTSAARSSRSIETVEYLRMARRILRSAGKRVGDDDPSDLADLIALRDALDVAILAAVRGLRRAGYTWQEIGDATGTTRQAAIMKWTHKL